jgi:hypothetical protein
MRSRRKNKFPSHISVELSFGKFGPIEELEVPFDRAAIQYPVPVFERLNEGYPINSTGRLEIKSIPDGEAEAQKRLQAILRRHKAESYKTYSTSINPTNFARLVWKIANGFFFAACPISQASSQAAERALDKTKYLSATADGKINYYFDLLSIGRDELEFHGEDGCVFTREEESHQHIWCAINLLPKFDLPIYLIRIDNKEGKEIQEHY